MVAAPDPHAVFVLALTVVAFILFTRPNLALETSSLVVLIALTLVFQLFPYEHHGATLRPVELYAGFGNEALVTICALMIVGRGLETTGALEPLIRPIARHWSASPLLSLLATLFICAVLSAFLNNTPIVVMLLPVLVAVSLRAGRPPSGLLMPMGLATLIGGMGTTIGTSTNLLVVSVAEDIGLRRFEMFDFSLFVVAAGVLGILYLWLLAPRLLPSREVPLTDSSPRRFDAVLYLREDSQASGMKFFEALDATEKKMTVERIQRGEQVFLLKLPTLTLRAGDRLYVNDTPENLKEYERALGATLHNVSDLEHPISEQYPLSAEGRQMTEVVVTPGSHLGNTTLKQARFAERFGLVVLAIHRARSPSVPIRTRIAERNLQTGDVLLMQGKPEQIAALKSHGDLLVLDATIDLPHTEKAPLALAIMAFVVLAAASGLVPILVSSVCGVGLMLLSGALSWRHATGALSRGIIFIVAASLALGLALTRTGGADYLAHLFVATTEGLPPAVLLSGLMLLMAVLTNMVSNNAAAVIGTPIAAGIAAQLGSDPEPFVLAVLFGANMSYATPIGYQTNLLILSAGGYRFSDFIRVGIPLTLIMWLSLSVLLSLYYGL